MMMMSLLLEAFDWIVNSRMKLGLCSQKEGVLVQNASYNITKKKKICEDASESGQNHFPQ